MKNHKHFHLHLLRSIKQLAREMPPLNGRMNPLLAALAGVLGAAGVGLVCQNRKDFFLSFGICFLALILAPVTGGLAIAMAVAICSYYIYQRVLASNAKIEARSKGGIIIDVEEVNKPYPPFIKPVSPVPPIIGPTTRVPSSVSESLRILDELLANRQITYAEYEARREEVLRRL